jgi:predicted DCC family thiol-disulfide oxidoreductase YuxK
VVTRAEERETWSDAAHLKKGGSQADRAAKTPEELTEAGPILLYDGDCGVCNATVKWVLEHEHATSTLRFAALGSPMGLALRRAAHVADDIDSLLWVENRKGKVYARLRSSAVLRVLGEARGAWTWLRVLAVVPPVVRDFFYDAFAKIRHRVIEPSCFVPLPAQRGRFLE